MSISEYLESELLLKRRAILMSGLIRKFGHDSVVQEASKFLNRNTEHVSVLFTHACTGENGNRIITLTEEIGNINNLFSIKPRDSAETPSAMVKRDIEEIRTDMIAARPGLWQPIFATITAETCLEREIKNVTPTASKPAIASVGVKSAPATLYESSKPKVHAAMEQKKVESSVPEKPRAKFQVPLDRLDDPDSELPTDKKREEVEMKENSTSSQGAPEVVVSSPSAKRQRMEEPVEEIAESIASSEPQYREVVVKKKVVVTEYEMGPNGEMIVKDVEKMVEETKMELVKPPSKQSSVRSVAQSQTKKEQKPAKPGQATLTGFFKPKN
jgi:hypothetical protein